ncbi:MAG: hypothetical protein V1793_22380 [Pseudomonadota bacterium]
MKLVTGTGFAAVLGGLGTLGFQSLSALMNQNNVWQQITLGKCAGDWVDKVVGYIPVGTIRDHVLYMANDLPLYQLLLGLGIILVVLGALLRR